MSYISEAHKPIVQKYNFHTNNAFFILENKYQAEDIEEPRYNPCHNVGTQEVYPISGNECKNSPTVMMNRDWTQLPRVPLPYVPPQNLPHNVTPRFPKERIYCGPQCSTPDTCDNLLQRLNRNSQGFNFVAK